jgi:CheY-like chemotaxis protein
MDGLTATRRIREMHGPASRIPIVALTAHAQPNEVEECRNAGMDAHLAKPIDLGQLNALIARVLNQKSEENARRAAEAEAAIAALREDCRRDILELPGKLGALLKITSPDERVRGIAALAHSVAGTAGSFGFKDVSDAAFRLQAAAKAILAGKPEEASLDEAIETFVHVAEKAA